MLGERTGKIFIEKRSKGYASLVKSTLVSGNFTKIKTNIILKVDFFLWGLVSTSEFRTLSQF